MDHIRCVSSPPERDRDERTREWTRLLSLEEAPRRLQYMLDRTTFAWLGERDRLLNPTLHVARTDALLRAILRWHHHEQPEIRERVFGALECAARQWDVPGKMAVPALRAGLRDEHARVRIRAARACRALTPLAELRAELEHAARTDAVYTVRWNAIAALAKRADAPPDLAELLLECEPRLGRHTLAWLGAVRSLRDADERVELRLTGLRRRLEQPAVVESRALLEDLRCAAASTRTGS
jgi:hypothetical protein